MYKKFNTKILNIDFNKLVGELEWNAETLTEFRLVNLEYLNSIIENKLHFGIQPESINITKIVPPGVRPHKDGYGTSLNIYLTTDQGSETLFYRDNNLGTVVDQGGGALAYEDNMQILDRFTAVLGDVVLLKTSIPHSVKLIANEPRWILRFVWFNSSFEEIADSIKILN